MTQQNKSFIRDVVHDKYGGPPAIIGGVSTYQQSPLKIQPMDRGSWFRGCRRSGLIARNIGIYPMWLKDGTRVLTTLLQVSHLLFLFFLGGGLHLCMLEGKSILLIHISSLLIGTIFPCYIIVKNLYIFKNRT